MYSMYFVFSYFICPVYCSIDTNACQYVRLKKLLYVRVNLFGVNFTFSNKYGKQSKNEATSKSRRNHTKQ